MIFDVDFYDLVPKIMKVSWRTPKHIQWLRVLVAPVIWLKGLFDTNRAKNLYYLGHNSQVYSIEAGLNDALDNTDRGIYISDPEWHDPISVYLVSENKPVWLGLVSEEGSTTYPDPQWLYTGAETEVSGYMFIVWVPTAVTLTSGYSEARVRGIVDKYRLPSKWNYNVLVY